MSCIRRNLEPGLDNLFPGGGFSFQSGNVIVRRGESVLLGENFLDFWSPPFCDFSGWFGYFVVNKRTGEETVIYFGSFPEYSGGYSPIGTSKNSVATWHTGATTGGGVPAFTTDDYCLKVWNSNTNQSIYYTNQVMTLVDNDLEDDIGIVENCEFQRSQSSFLEQTDSSFGTDSFSHLYAGLDALSPAAGDIWLRGELQTIGYQERGQVYGANVFIYLNQGTIPAPNEEPSGILGTFGMTNNGLFSTITPNYPTADDYYIIFYFEIEPGIPNFQFSEHFTITSFHDKLSEDNLVGSDSVEYEYKNTTHVESQDSSIGVAFLVTHDHRVITRHLSNLEDKFSLGDNRTYRKNEWHDKDVSDEFSLDDPMIARINAKIDEEATEAVSFSEDVGYDFGDVQNLNYEVPDETVGSDSIVFNRSRPHELGASQSIGVEEDGVNFTNYGLDWSSTLPSVLVKGVTYEFKATQRGSLVGSGISIEFQLAVVGSPPFLVIGTSNSSPISSVFWTIPDSLSNSNTYVVIAKLSTSTAYDDNTYAESTTFSARKDRVYNVSNSVFIGNITNPEHRLNEKYSEDITEETLGIDTNEFDFKVMYREEAFDFPKLDDNITHHLSVDREFSTSETTVITSTAQHLYHDSHHGDDLTEELTIEDEFHKVVDFKNHFGLNIWELLGSSDIFEFKLSRPFTKDMTTSNVSVAELISSALYRNMFEDLTSSILVMEDVEYEFGDHTHVITLGSGVIVEEFSVDYILSTPYIMSPKEDVFMEDSVLYDFIRRIVKNNTDDVEGSDSVEYYQGIQHVINLNSSISPNYTTNQDSPFGEGSDMVYFWQGYDWESPVPSENFQRSGEVLLSYYKRSNFTLGSFDGSGTSLIYFTIGDDSEPTGSTLIYQNIDTKQWPEVNAVLWWPEGLDGNAQPPGSTIISECSTKYYFWIKGLNSTGWFKVGEITIRADIEKSSLEEIGFDELNDHHSHPHTRWNLAFSEELKGSDENTFQYRSSRLGPYISEEAPSLEDEITRNRGQKVTIEDSVDGSDLVFIDNILHFEKETIEIQGLLDDVGYDFGDVQNLSFSVVEKVSFDESNDHVVGHIINLYDDFSPQVVNIEDGYGVIEGVLDSGDIDEAMTLIHRFGWHDYDAGSDIYVTEEVLYIQRIARTSLVDQSFGMDDSTEYVCLSHHSSEIADNTQGSETAEFYFMHVKFTNPLQGETYQISQTISIMYSYILTPISTYEESIAKLYYEPNESESTLITTITNTGSAINNALYDWEIPAETTLSDAAKVKLHFTWKRTGEPDVEKIIYSPDFIMLGYPHSYDVNLSVGVGEFSRRLIPHTYNLLEGIELLDTTTKRFRKGWSFEIEERAITLPDTPSAGEIYGMSVLTYGSNWNWNAAISLAITKRVRYHVDEKTRLYYSPKGTFEDDDLLEIAEIPPHPSGPWMPLFFSWLPTHSIAALSDGNSRFWATSFAKFNFELKEEINLTDNSTNTRDNVHTGDVLDIEENVEYFKGRDLIRNLESGLNVYTHVEYDKRRLEFDILEIIILDDNMVKG